MSTMNCLMPSAPTYTPPTAASGESLRRPRPHLPDALEGPRRDHEPALAAPRQREGPENSGPSGTRLLWAILGSKPPERPTRSAGQASTGIYVRSGHLRLAHF